jgi:hypothetical protein
MFDDDLYYMASIIVKRIHAEAASVTLVAPEEMAAAVYARHRYARELDTPESSRARVPHDRVFEDT